MVSILVLLHCGNMKGMYMHVSIIIISCHAVHALPFRCSDLAPVCSGGHLELICTTTGQFLGWRFRAIRGNETVATEFTRTIIPTGSASDAMSQLVVNSTVFCFSRTSAENSLPVMSRLLISPVSNGLNGTVINCVDMDTAESSSTTIIVRERDSLHGMDHLVLVLIHHLYINVVHLVEDFQSA